MSNKKAVTCLFALVMLCSTFSSGTSETGVRFKLIRESVITVPVLVNGRGPFDFVFDTGAESSLLDSRLAAELNISPVDRILLFSPTGNKLSARGFADEISLGRIKVLHSEIVIGELDGLHRVSPRIRGIIGQNVLSHFDYVIDYAHSMIGFETDVNREEQVSGMKTKVVRVHGCPILTAQLSPGVNLQLSLDSGSSDLVLYKGKIPDYARSGNAQLQGSNGEIGAHTDVIPRMDVGSVTLRGLRTAFVENVHGSGVDGLMPTRLFSAVYFNNSEGYVILRPR